MFAMNAGRVASIVVAGLVGCSTFGANSNDPPAPAGPDANYNPKAEIGCDSAGSCHPPQFCCWREFGKNTCEESGCLESDNARLRCSDFSACAPGLFCCLRLDNSYVRQVTCEKECPKQQGGSGVFQLCGDGDANTSGRCSGACVPLRQLVGGGIFPSIVLRGCE
jgi:hypothetical protein